MGSSTLLAVALWLCPIPNLSGKIPPEILDRAVLVCRTRYNGCAVSVTEKGPQNYWVICRRQ